MYTDYVTAQEEALCHLFFHCCLKDGVFEQSELNQISAKIVALGLRSAVNIKEEVVHYNTYKPHITDEIEYLKYLIQLINPVNDLALYSYCLELTMSDSSFDLSEEILTDRIAGVLALQENERQIVKEISHAKKSC